jgi:DNA transposition AAA+ family ATPase
MTDAACVNGTIAPLRNISLFAEMMARLVNTPDHLTPLGVFYGWSGYGKTKSATYGANKYRALYLEVGASWTLKSFCQAALRELGVKASGTIPAMVEQIIETMATETRPMIIDEFDHVCGWGEKSVNVVREILDKSGAPIVLIGEEMLPTRLKRWERFDNRVRSWVAAQPADGNDAVHLARLYSRDVTIAPTLLADMAEQAGGVVRRICHGIETVREFAAVNGLSEVSMADWGNQPYWQSRPAVRRQHGA